MKREAGTEVERIPGLSHRYERYSYILRKVTRGEPSRQYLDGKQGGVSFQTAAGLRRWAIEHHWGAAQRQELVRQLSFVTIYLVDDELLTIWAELTARPRQIGRPIIDADAWIASTAVLLDVPLVAHNRRHFEHIEGLRLVSFAATGS